MRLLVVRAVNDDVMRVVDILTGMSGLVLCQLRDLYLRYTYITYIIAIVHIYAYIYMHVCT